MWIGKTRTANNPQSKGESRRREPIPRSRNARRRWSPVDVGYRYARRTRAALRKRTKPLAFCNIYNVCNVYASREEGSPMDEAITPVATTPLLRIGQAAAYLGLTACTLRNWDRSGQLVPQRHPVNGYRLYTLEQLDAVLAKTKKKWARDG